MNGGKIGDEAFAKLNHGRSNLDDMENFNSIIQRCRILVSMAAIFMVFREPIPKAILLAS